MTTATLTADDRIALARNLGGVIRAALRGHDEIAPVGIRVTLHGGRHCTPLLRLYVGGRAQSSIEVRGPEDFAVTFYDCHDEGDEPCVYRTPRALVEALIADAVMSI